MSFIILWSLSSVIVTAHTIWTGKDYNDDMLIGLLVYSSPFAAICLACLILLCFL